MEKKITLIGGGSLQWAPKFLVDLVLTRELENCELFLHDIDTKALERMDKLGRKIFEKTGGGFHLKSSTSLEESLKGADYVILSISTGGLDTMQHDLEIPLKYGIYQSVGCTVGPGGLSRALRSIPVVVDIAKKMEKFCPNAWLINYTNPMSTLCRAVTKTTNIRTIGLCHELLSVLRDLRHIFNVEKETDIQTITAGINHFTWILQLRVNGEDGFPLLRKYIEREGERLKKDFKSLDWESLNPFQDNKLLKFELFKKFGYLPAAGDRAIVEFFPYFLTEETRAGRDYGIKLTRIEHRLEMRKQRRKAVESILEEKQPIKLEHSDEKAYDIITSLATGKKDVFMMNLPNQGQIANLPPEVIVETPALVNTNGIHPVSIGQLPSSILSLMVPHVVNQEMIVEAALTGNKDLALQALLNDPLMKNYEDAPKMFDELLEANAEYLPQF